MSLQQLLNPSAMHLLTTFYCLFNTHVLVYMFNKIYTEITQQCKKSLLQMYVVSATGTRYMLTKNKYYRKSKLEAHNF